MNIFDLITEFKFNDHIIKPGEEVYVITAPSGCKARSEYQLWHYKLGHIKEMYKNDFALSKDSPSKFKRDQYEFYSALGDSYLIDYRVKFINYEGQEDRYSTLCKRKSLYFSFEKDIMLRDLNNLNKIYEFKKKQKIEFDNFIKEFSEQNNWSYNDYMFNKGD